MPNFVSAGLRTFTTRQFVGIGVASLVLFAVSYLPVGLSVAVSARGGDVTGMFATTWRVATGIATVASFVLSYVTFRDGTDDSRPIPVSGGPDTVIHVEGGDGNVTLNITLEDGNVESVRTDGVETSERDPEATRE